MCKIRPFDEEKCPWSNHNFENSFFLILVVLNVFRKLFCTKYEGDIKKD